MRKLFISADIEGCAGVASQNALMPDKWEWAQARQWMTAEVSCAAEAAFAAGFDEVIVADGHGNAHNIDPDKLPDNVRLIRSWPRPLLQMEGVDDPDIEGVVFIGYHDAASSPGGVLAHTFHGGVYRDVRLNGVSASEGYFNAALAGAFDKPVLFVSGDERALADARRYAPDAVLHATKQALGWRAASSLPPRQAQRALRSAVAEALARARPAPFVIAPPVTLELEITSQLAAEMLAYLSIVERVGACAVRTQCESVADAMRFMSFAMFYAPNGAIAL